MPYSNVVDPFPAQVPSAAVSCGRVATAAGQARCDLDLQSRR